MRHAVAPDQLPLALEDAPAVGRVPAPVTPRLAAPPVASPGPGVVMPVAAMLAGDGPAPFDDEGWFFEPWWPGRPATLVVEGGRLRIAMHQLADPTAAFPELRGLPDQLTVDAAVLAGTLLVLDRDGRPDAALLRGRLGGVPGRGGTFEGTGAFVASDLLAASGVSLAAWPFAQRRARLIDVLMDGDRALVARGVRGEGHTLATAAASMGLDAIAARRLSARWQAGVAPEAFLRLPVLAPLAADPRPLLVLLQRLPLHDEQPGG
ncbi:MAG: hypothetical protein U0869_21240 [Chloroflexota bacterium]